MSTPSRVLDAAEDLVDWLEFKRNSSVVMNKYRAEELKVELRFLITSINYPADLQDFYYYYGVDLMKINEHINKLHNLLASRKRWRMFWNLLGSYRFDNDVDEAVSNVLYGIGFLQEKMRDFFIDSSISRLQLDLDWRSNEVVVEFVECLRKKVLSELPESIYSSPVVSSSISVLKKKLGCLKCLISLAAKRCNNINELVDDESFIELFARAEVMTKYASNLASSMMPYSVNEAMEHKLEWEFRKFSGEMDPVKSRKVQRIYLGVLMKMKLKTSINSNTYEMDETAIHFLDSLSSHTSHQLQYMMDETAIHFLDSLSSHTSHQLRHEMPEMQQLGINLDSELTRLRSFLEVKFIGISRDDEMKFSEFWKSSDVLPQLEALLIEAGCVVYSRFDDTSCPKLLEKLKVFNDVVLVPEFRRHHRYVPPLPQINNFPMIDGLTALEIVLRNLKELLNHRVSSTSLLKHPIQTIQKDLEFLQSFLNTIAEQRHGQQKLEDLWTRIIHVVYETEYLVDLVLLQDGDSDANHIFWISDLIEEIKLLKTEASEISNDNIGIQEQSLAKISRAQEPKMYAPKLDEELVGFEDEKEKVIEQLVGESKKLEIVAIVGMPGLGKTFLAHKIYNHPFIKSQFYVHAWCSVSQVYERRNLLTNILCQVNESRGGMSTKTDEELAGELNRSLLGQKYLIVLDDIWDIGAWYALRRSFPESNMGSRILFTSRFSRLDSPANFPIKIHPLRSFLEAESWELLQKKVFQIERCPEELFVVGQQIAKRCNGLPLAIVVVAGVLARMVKKQEQWEKVRDGLGPYITDSENRWWIDILDLSYKSLPNHLKLCFLYFGAFPEDKEIPIRKLTRLWIAEGFVQQNETNLEYPPRQKETNLEYLAEDYLKELINRSLVIASKNRSTGGVKTCLVHDLVREFCLTKAKEENFFLLIEGHDDDASGTRYDQRRVVVHDKLGKEILSGCSGSFVRSLLFFNQKERTLVPKEIFSFTNEFKLLKVLDLTEINLGNSFPKAMNSLVLLRYLAVFGSFHSLPSSIADLRSLETLIVRGFIETLSPDIILNMTKLRHLLIDYFLFSQLWSIDLLFQLDSIQVISRVQLFSDNDLELIRRFTSLKKLTCVFGDSIEKDSIKVVLEFLSQLETFKVSYTGYQKFPGMFSLPQNIRKLTMSGFRLSWEEISIVGKLPNLEVLKLLDDAFEGEEWSMEGEGFSKLKFLKLKLLDIKRWIADDYHFPSIEQLVLHRCYRLVEIPSFLEDITSLKVIQVYHCNDSLKDQIKQYVEGQEEYGNKVKMET